MLREKATHKRKTRKITQNPGNDSYGILKFRRGAAWENTERRKKLLKKKKWDIIWKKKKKLAQGLTTKSRKEGSERVSTGAKGQVLDIAKIKENSN